MNISTERFLKCTFSQPFKVDNGGVHRIEVDVVSDGGAVWKKAIARKPEALDDISRGNGLYGQKSVVDHAKTYLECAKLHPHLFIPPKVHQLPLPQPSTNLLM